MYIERVPNRNSRPAILLREGWREGGKVKKRTLANLSDWPEAKLQALAAVLKGDPVVGDIEHAFEIVRSLPHGHVSAILGVVSKLGLDRILSRSRCTERALCLAMLVARITSPGSKLALSRALSETNTESTLGSLLEVTGADEDQCYAAMDWLLARQASIEATLAKRHLAEGSLVLYDVTSTYFEGRKCSLAKHGHSRDGKKDKLQIVIGLLTNDQGCPVAVEVFEGNTADPKTLGIQIEKLRDRFALQRFVIVGDRGMITQARIRDELRHIEKLDWITCLRGPAIAGLVQRGSLQLSLFEKLDLAEITDSAFPGERLMVCKNPLLAEERARKRVALLEATERELEKVHRAVTRQRRPLRGSQQISLRVGRVLGRFKVAKHFTVTIGDDSFRWERNIESISTEAALDGFYVVRTTVPAAELSSADVVLSYKSLARVERAFRSIKTVDLHIRPIHHRKADRVRAHVFLCMLAYYVEWHMRRALAPILFDDEDPAGAEARRDSVVHPARRSPSAEQKDFTKVNQDGLPVQSFQSLLRDLSTITKNRIQPKTPGSPAFDIVTKPTPYQRNVLELLDVALLP